MRNNRTNVKIWSGRRTLRFLIDCYHACHDTCNKIYSEMMMLNSLVSSQSLLYEASLAMKKRTMTKKTRIKNQNKTKQNKPKQPPKHIQTPKRGKKERIKIPKNNSRTNKYYP